MEEQGLDHPTLGKEYELYWQGECTGKATFVNDPHHGLCFIGITDKGEKLVYWNVDDWVEAAPV